MSRGVLVRRIVLVTCSLTFLALATELPRIMRAQSSRYSPSRHQGEMVDTLLRVVIADGVADAGPPQVSHSASRWFGLPAKLLPLHARRDDHFGPRRQFGRAAVDAWRVPGELEGF